MNLPSLSRRRETAVRDTDGDGRIDGRDGQPVVTDQDSDRTTYRSAAADPDLRDADAKRRAAERAATARLVTARADAPTGQVAAVDGQPGRAGRLGDGDVDTRPTPPVADPAAERSIDRDRDGVPDRSEAPVVTGPKPRTSLLATLGLVVSVVAAAAVLTGTLAGYGIALGAAGAVLAVLGLIATRRRHVAGTTDALIGMLVGLAAVVLGVIAMTGQFDWPTTDGDQVTRFREWLDSQFAHRV
ncbi:thrombospondin [Micromonospora sp. KC723]|uniref:thrombospondin n=1 Tax=Micromonospora sp. KC723 TaxID=2530381 RepID=UPI00104BC9FF|nr:thrombospondin [Micromonospora sp. KC723]TDB73975.1 thrombospondin [Micromonospora sp. KC723]